MQKQMHGACRPTMLTGHQKGKNPCIRCPEKFKQKHVHSCNACERQYIHGYEQTYAQRQMTRTHNFIILAFVLVSHKTFWSGCFAPVACCGRGGATVPLSLTLVTPLTRLSQATPAARFICRRRSNGSRPRWACFVTRVL